MFFNRQPVPPHNPSFTVSTLPIKAYLNINPKENNADGDLVPRRTNKFKGLCLRNHTFESHALPREIRRFRISPVNITLEKLKQELTRIARLDERELKIENLRYKDEDGDLICCDSEEEFKEALICCKDSTCVVFVDLIDMKQVTSSKKDTTERTSLLSEIKENYVLDIPPVVHSDIICNGCNMKGIEGNRYKCSVCDDYDLCTQCYQKKIHKHDFILIEKPISENVEIKQDYLAKPNVVAPFKHPEPKVEPQSVEPPKSEPQPVEPPKPEPQPIEPQPIEPPKPEPQPIELPKVEPPKPEPQPIELPKVEPPKPEPQPIELPKVEPPKPEPPKPEPPKPEPQPEPEVVVPPKFATSLQILEAMGFGDRKRILFLLQKYNNNVPRVVEDLTS